MANGIGARVLSGLRLAQTALPVLLLGYPISLYFALTRYGAKAGALVALGGALVLALRKGGQTSLALLRAPLGVALLSLLAALTNEPRLLLALPVFINLLLLVVFTRSLHAPQSYVERLARLQDPQLTPAKVQHCRQVTYVWIGFFSLNAAYTAALALAGWLKAWALHTSFIAYILMGSLFCLEWLVRRQRFGKTSSPNTEKPSA